MTYKRGDIIEVFREQDGRESTHVVWRTSGDKVFSTEEVEIDSEDVRRVCGEVSEEEAFQEKEKWELGHIPPEFHGALSLYAWRVSHAYGYDEVIMTLGDLVELLEEPIRKFAERSRKDV